MPRTGKNVASISSLFGLRLLLFVASLALLTSSASAQQRLKTMPRYERFQKLSKEVPGSVKLGALSVT